MRVLQVIVSRAGFRNIQHNTVRSMSLDFVFRTADRLKCDLIQLPAGYWTVADEASRDELIESAREYCHRMSVGLAAGIDMEAFEKTGVTEAIVREGRLPFFGFASDG